MAILISTKDKSSQASEGLVRLSTNAEASAGLRGDLAVTPAGLKAALDALLDGAPAALDTLNELAAAINDDANFFTTVQGSIDNLQGQINTLSGVNLGGLQGEIDQIEAGAGLNTDGTYTAPTSSNYLGSATTLKGADSLLDAQIKQNADDIASLGNGSLTAIQSEIDDIESSVGLQSDGTLGTWSSTNYYSASASIKEAIEGLDGAIDTNETAIAAAQSDADAAQADIGRMNTALGLSATGTYVAHSGTNFIDSATTAKGARESLDSQIKTNADDIAALSGGSGLSGIQSEVDDTQAGVGLATDGSYVSRSGTNYIDSASSVVGEITLLDSQIKTNEDAIALKADASALSSLATATQLAAVNSEINATQTGAGLETNGSLSAPSGSNYLGSISSLKGGLEALDSQIKTNEDDIATKASSSSVSTLQSEVDATQTGAGLGSNGAYSANSSTNFLGSATSLKNADEILDARIATNASDISALSGGSGLSGIQSELDATQTGAGLSAAGAYSANSSANFIATASSLKDADDKLDAQVKTNADAISNLASSSAITNLQSEVDDTQSAIGLATDGSFSANSSGNFISSASSVRGEINALDSQLSNTQSDLDTAEASLASLTTTVGNKADSSTVSTLQSEVDATQAGVGLNTNGTYSAHTSSSYINGATSVKSALGLLDAQVDTNETDIANLTSTVSTLTAGSGATSGQITVLQNEIDATQTGAGLSSSGAYTAPGSSNYLGSASSLKDADDKLDAQIKTNADAIALRATSASVTSLTSTVNSNTSSISTNTSSISGNASDIASLQSDVASNDSDISALQSDKASASSVTALQSEVDATQSGAGLGTGGAYTAPSSSNYLGSASSLADADDKLDAQIKTNEDDIASNTSDIATNTSAIAGLASNSTITAMQTEIDAIESGVGLNSDGSYTALTGNFNTASTLKGAVSSLDTQVKTNADAISSNDSDISSLSSQISSNDSDISSLQTLANTHESSIGLDSDGGYTAISGANFADSGTSLKAAVAQLDTQLKTTQDEVDAEETARANAITTVNSSISTLQSEVDATQTGAGLTSAGAYTANSGANYIDSASSLKDADDKLDTQIKANADAIASNDSDISSLNSTVSTLATSSTVSALQSELDTTQASAGLNANGSLPAFTNSGGGNLPIIGGGSPASSLKEALHMIANYVGQETLTSSNDLSEEVVAHGGEIDTLNALANTIEASVGLSASGGYVSRSGSNYLDSASSVVGESSLLDAQIKTNETAIATKASTSSLNTLQTEVDAIESAVGLSSSGAFVSHSGTNYIDGASSIKGSLELLDTAVKARETAITNEAATRLANDNTLATAINTVEASVGLEADGSLSISGTNFLNSSGTIVAALDTLDTNQKLLSDIRTNMIQALGLSTTGEKNNYANTNFISNSEDLIESVEALDAQLNTTQNALDVAEAAITSNDTDIATNVASINTVEASVGLSTAGAYVSRSGSNYIDSASTIAGEIGLLDTQVKTNADAIATFSTTATVTALTARVAELEIGDGGVWTDDSSNDEVFYEFKLESMKSHLGPFEVQLGGANGYIRALVASENATTDLIFFGSKAERDGGRHFDINSTSGDGVFKGKFS